VHPAGIVDERPARERRPGQLRSREGRRRRPHEDRREGVGPVQRPREHRRVRARPHPVRPPPFLPRTAWLTRGRLTAAKESGATIEIAGKKVALGVPDAGNRSAATGPKAFPLIPLARGATPDEAAAAMLLYVVLLVRLLPG
jgi:hypothetical protein